MLGEGTRGAFEKVGILSGPLVFSYDVMKACRVDIAKAIGLLVGGLLVGGLLLGSIVRGSFG